MFLALGGLEALHPALLLGDLFLADDRAYFMSPAQRIHRWSREYREAKDALRAEFYVTTYGVHSYAQLYEVSGKGGVGVKVGEG
jgi:hypothetical protein